MAYIPFKFRKKEGLCVPVGPFFSKSKKVQFNVNGIEINFLAPIQDPFVQSLGTASPRTSYDLDYINSSPISSDNDAWYYYQIMARSWGFAGPKGEGKLGAVCFYLNIVKQKNINESVSFLHARGFEGAVSEYLTESYGSRLFKGEQKWFAPVNWKFYSGLPLPAAGFDVMPNPKDGGAVKRMLVVGISNQHLLVFHFDVFQHVVGPLAERDMEVDRLNMNNLVDSVIASLFLELSAELKAEVASISGREAVQDSFAPLLWGSSAADKNYIAELENGG